MSSDKLFVSNFLTWFAAWGPIVTAIANPVLLDVQYRQQKVSKHERQILVAQEIGKQVINVTSMLTLFALTMLTVPLLIKRFAKPNLQTGKPGQDLKADLSSLLTNLTGFLAMTFISPILTPMLLRLWNRNESEKDAVKNKSARFSVVARQEAKPELPSSTRNPLLVTNLSHSQPVVQFAPHGTSSPTFAGLSL